MQYFGISGRGKPLDAQDSRFRRRSNVVVRARDSSGGGEEEKKGPGRGGGEGHGGANDLDEHRMPAHVLSSARQKKGARAAIRDETTLQRRIRDGVSVHDGLQQRRSLLEAF